MMSEESPESGVFLREEDSELVKMSEESPESPRSPPPVAARARRSSQAAARRLSRASTVGGGGLPLEDLLATIPSQLEAEPRQRMERLLQLVVSSTTRDLAEVFRDHEDEELEEAAKSLRMKVRWDQIASTTVEQAVEAVGAGLEVEGEVVGGELKKMREYTGQLKEESDQWAKFLAERKEMLRNAKRNAKLVETGEISLGEETKWSLSSEERRDLDQIAANIKEASSQLEASRSEPGAEVVLRDITTSCVRLEAEQDRLSQRLGEAVRQLHSRAESLATSSASTN